MRFDRRDFLKLGGAAAAQIAGGASLFALGCEITPYGELQEPDENGIRLPAGFRSRILARQGDPVGDSGYLWHRAPDGGAVFKVRQGWVYVSNSEVGSKAGGVGALRFDRKGEVIDAYSICSGTSRNCSGGATPWDSWLTCEEVGNGLVWECDPLGEEDPMVRPALGRFNHEAVAVDLRDDRFYLTEDRTDGRLYRFTPHRRERLDAGVLEVAEVLSDGIVVWHVVPDPTPNFSAGGVATRLQVPQSTAFRGGEGMVVARGHVYFTTKGDNRVWDFDIDNATLRIVYEPANDPAKQLSGVDNITTTHAGDLIVAEDGGNMELVLVGTNGLAQPLLRVEGQDGSELVGPAFDPSGFRLYFSSQRGIDGSGRGITYEILGPFRFRRMG